MISWKLKDEFGSNPDELHKAIKEALGTRRGDGMKWCARPPVNRPYAGAPITDCCPVPVRSHLACKELVAGQTFQRLLGYVFKDEGKPHFQNTTFGDITRAEIDAGMQEWASLKIDYMDGKIALTKMNIFARLHAFVEMDPVESRGTFCETVARAINSRKYMISANMFCTTGGQMRAESAEAYWRVINGEECTAAMVQNILCTKEYKPRYYQNLQDHANDSLYKIRRSEDVEMGDYVPLAAADDCLESISSRRSDSVISISKSDAGVSMSKYQKIKKRLHRMRAKFEQAKKKNSNKNKFIITSAEGSDNEEEEDDDEESYESSFIDDSDES